MKRTTSSFILRDLDRSKQNNDTTSVDNQVQRLSFPEIVQYLNPIYDLNKSIEDEYWDKVETNDPKTQVLDETSKKMVANKSR